MNLNFSTTEDIKNAIIKQLKIDIEKSGCSVEKFASKHKLDFSKLRKILSSNDLVSFEYLVDFTEKLYSLDIELTKRKNINISQSDRISIRY